MICILVQISDLCLNFTERTTKVGCRSMDRFGWLVHSRGKRIHRKKFYFTLSDAHRLQKYLNRLGARKDRSRHFRLTLKHMIQYLTTTSGFTFISTRHRRVCRTTGRRTLPSRGGVIKSKQTPSKPGVLGHLLNGPPGGTQVALSLSLITCSVPTDEFQRPEQRERHTRNRNEQGEIDICFVQHFH